MTQVYNDGDIQIREIKRGSKYSIRVRLKDEDGNRKYSPTRRVEASCKNDAMKAALDYQAELLEDTPMSVGDCIDAYHDARDKLDKVDKLTIERESIDVRRLKQYFAGYTLAELTPDEIERIYVKMREDGVSKYSVYRAHMLLKRIMRRAYISREIDRNPCDAIEGITYSGPDPERKAEKRITTEQLVAFAAKVRGMEKTGKLVALYLGMHTGLRRGEALALVWADVDFAASQIHVRKQYGQQHRRKKPKASSARTVKVDGTLMRYLGEWKEQQAGELNRQGADTPVCSNERGGFIDPGNFSRWRTAFFVREGLGHYAKHEEWVDSRGIKRVRHSVYVGADFQALRRAQATMLVGANVDLPTAANRLGHQIPTMMKYYAEAEEANADIAAAKVGQIIGGEQVSNCRRSS